MKKKERRRKFFKSSETDGKTQPCDRDGDREKEIARLGDGYAKWNTSALKKTRMRPAGCNRKYGPTASGNIVAISSNHNVRNHRKARRETRAGMENKKASFRLPTRPHQKNWSERTSSGNEYPKKKRAHQKQKELPCRVWPPTSAAS
jgi:hypothetical protein